MTFASLEEQFAKANCKLVDVVGLPIAPRGSQVP